MAFVVGGYVLINRRTLEAADMARSRLRTGPDGGVERTFSILKDDKISDVPFLNRLFSGKNWVDAISIQLTRAGSNLRPVNFLMLEVTSGFFGMLLSSRMAPGLAPIVLTAAGWLGPVFWLRWRQKKRLKEFEQQLPDAIDMLVSAMKAGYSFQAATQFIGEEMTAPAGPEFARFYDEQRLGIDVRQALLNLQGRLESLDLKMFVTA